MRGISTKALLLAGVLAISAPSAGAATIVLNNTGGVEPGTQAARGFRAAAEFWSSKISNDITIHLDVGFDHLGQDVLGSTGSTVDIRLTQDVYQSLQANQHSALDATAVANLQTLHQSDFGPGVGAISMVTPGYTGETNGVGFGIDTAHPILDDGGDFNNVLLGSTTANLKALGLETDQSIVDGEITFSSDFLFDFNPTDGITAGQSDFIAVAIHEIGHALGFVSAVDDYDFLGLPNGPAALVNCAAPGEPAFNCSDYPVNDTWWGYTGDLFRYDKAGELDWNPGDPNYFSVDGGQTNLALFSTGAFNGDTWQGSHWKAPVAPPFCANLIGILNPYSCSGAVGQITGMDFAYFDAIGYNFNFDFNANDGVLFSSADAFRAVPEPGVWALMLTGFGLVGATVRRRRQASLEA